VHILDAIFFWARTIPLRPALIWPRGVITYRSLTDGIERAAEYFARNLPDRSKPITIGLGSEPRLLLASLALLRANYSIIVAARQELPHLPVGESNTLVHDGAEPPPGMGTSVLFDESWLTVTGQVTRELAPVNFSKLRQCEILFASSGAAKTADMTARTQQGWNGRTLCNVGSGFIDYQRALLVTGVDNAPGLSRAYGILHAGKTVCFAPPGVPMLWLANNYDIDTVTAFSHQALALAQLQEKLANYPLTALKSLTLCDFTLTENDLQRIKNGLCRKIIVEYSPGETGIVAAAPHDMIADIPDATGFIVPDAEVQIVDAQNHVLPPGSKGFVGLRTPQFLANYQIDEADVWFYSGDVGWLTDDGVLCIAKANDDLRSRVDSELSLLEFEDFLRSCPGVKDAGTCSLQNEAGLEEVWIGLVLEPSADMIVLHQCIEARNFGSCIKRLYVVESIPRDMNNTVERQQLRSTLLNLTSHA
jgi:acyl-CoA synthetase (AMP-forming)/AMP-acid ligase II